MFKKMMLIGSMALAALAFALPVSAASANWIETDTNAPITSDASLTFTGQACFNLKNQATGACAVLDIDILLEAGTTTGTVTSFKDTDCTGKGALAGLTCTGTPLGLEWVIHKVGDHITITDFKLDTHYYSPLDPTHSSPVSTTTLEGDLWATVDDPHGISSITIENDGVVLANGNEADVHGILEVEEEDAGTYATTEATP